MLNCINKYPSCFNFLKICPMNFFSLLKWIVFIVKNASTELSLNFSFSAFWISNLDSGNFSLAVFISFSEQSIPITLNPRLLNILTSLPFPQPTSTIKPSKSFYLRNCANDSAYSMEWFSQCLSLYFEYNFSDHIFILKFTI